MTETTSTPTTPQEKDGHEMRMAFLAHLGELRDRGLRAFIAVFIGTLIGFVFAAQGLEVLRGPFCEIALESSQAADCRFQLLDPTSGIMVYFRVALLIGGILSIPVVTYQFMAFVVPGLTKRERRLVFMALPAITLLFLVGVVFSWFVLIPPALTFLNGFLPDLFRPDWTAQGYLRFTTSLIFWMGVAFETPLVFFVLSVLGVVTPQALIQNWRLAVVGASIAAAMITPTIDPVNMFLVMGPLLVLYAISILLSFIGVRINRGQSVES
ncbi:MAG: twin-arginine translocase subunit TatC [Anaerolineae bacterium]